MRTVTVTGRGQSRVVPDTAVLRVGAVRRGAAVGEVWDALATTTATLTEVAARHTERRRISSYGVSVWPWHDHEGRRSGFEARHSYVVVTDDLATAGRLLDELAATVGDDLVVDSVALEVGEDSEARARARDDAFADAHDKAAALARLAGDALGQVVSIVEGSAPGLEAGHDVGLAAHKAGGLEPGEMSVGVDVTVTWELTRAT